MSVFPPTRALPPLLALALAALAISLATAAGAVTPGCDSFRSQGEAQDYFTAAAGSPRHPVGALDPDRDGVACETRPAPYKGYATLGYNLRKRFFYGTVAMPSGVEGAAGDKYACLYGNRAFAEGPRLLTIYRVAPGPDREVAANGAEAKPGVNRLIWKAEKETVTAASYYVAFEERVPLSPYGANECPGFRSAEVRLPPLRPAP